MSAPQNLAHPEHPPRQIIMIKKLLLSGQPCEKCARAEEMLRGRGVWDQIDEVVWAKEGDPESPGALFARRYGVELAPFFVIRRPGVDDEVVESTLKLIKLLQAPPAAAAAPVVAAHDAPAHAARAHAAGAHDRAAHDAPARDAGASPRPAPSAAEIAEAARELRDKSPQDILAWGLERHGASCALAFSGAEDVVLIDMAMRTGLPFSVFCLDTGRLHEETYRFIDRLRAFYGVDIQVMFPEPLAVESLVRKKGLFSFRQDGHGECCGIRKVEPLRRALGQFTAWATGQRRDQSPATRGEVAVVELDGSFKGKGGGALLKLNPLTFWTSAEVWDYIRSQRVPYNELHDHGFISIGCQPCTRPSRPGEHERAARWWWEEATQRECGLHLKKA